MRAVGQGPQGDRSVLSVPVALPSEPLSQLRVSPQLEKKEQASRGFSGSLAHSPPTPQHSTHTLPSSVSGLKPMEWNSVPCFSWPSLGLQGTGVGEGKQP